MAMILSLCALSKITNKLNKLISKTEVEYNRINV